MQKLLSITRVVDMHTISAPLSVHKAIEYQHDRLDSLFLCPRSSQTRSTMPSLSTYDSTTNAMTMAVERKVIDDAAISPASLSLAYVAEGENAA